MAVVAVTRLRLRSARFFLPFAWQALRSQIQAKAAPGNLGINLRRADGAYWTLTLWRERCCVARLHAERRAPVGHAALYNTSAMKRP